MLFESSNQQMSRLAGRRAGKAAEFDDGVEISED